MRGVRWRKYNRSLQSAEKNKYTKRNYPHEIETTQLQLMNLKSFFLSLLITVIACDSFARKKADSVYIEPYKQQFMVTSFVAMNSIVIRANNKEFKPNNLATVGVGFLVRNTVFNVRFGYGLLPVGKKEYGKTKALDIQFHKYARHYMLDLVFQRYQGFYQKGDKINLHPNMSVLQAGVEGTYLFNGKKISAKAAFEQSEKQLKSAGSFILGSGAYIHYLSAGGDTTTIGQNRIGNFQIGTSAGYAYSWVIGKHFLLSGMLTTGLNVGNELHKMQEGKLRVYPTVMARGAFGYHRSDWGVSFSFLLHNKSVYGSQSNAINLNSVNMQIAYVKNFDINLKKKKVQLN